MERALLKAAENGDLPKVQELLEQGCPANAHNQNGENALHLAAGGGHVSTIQYLAQHMGSLLHSTDNDGSTMLHWAAGYGHSDVVKFVIDEYKLDPTARDADGTTPVLLAALNGHTSIVDILVDQYHCSLTDVNNYGRNALHLAAQGGHVNTIRQLAMKMRSLLHNTDKSGSTMLHHAALGGHPEALQLGIEEFKLDPTARNKEGLTPVLLAFREGHSDLVDVLIGQYGCSMSEEEGLQYTFLAAAQNGDLDKVQDLIAQGCSVNTKDQDGSNSLHYAAAGGHVSAIRYLAAKMQSELHSADNDGYTMLHHAAQEDHTEVVQLLIDDYKLDPTARDKWGLTPVLRAACSGKPNVIDILERCYKCSLTEVTNDGENALHLAAEGGHVSTIRHLAPKIESLLHNTDDYGYTMLHYAAQYSHAEVVQLAINEYKLDPNALDKQSETPLHKALNRNHLKVAQVLLQKGALAGFKDRGLVVEAVMHGDIDAAKRLLNVAESGHNLQEFEEHYSKVVSTSASVTLQITKCTTIGPPRIGKTCLKHLLTEQEWDVEGGTASTDIMEAPEWVECYSVEEGGAMELWKLLPTEQQHGELLRAVNALTSSSAQSTATPSAVPAPTPIEPGAGLHTEMTDGPPKTKPIDASHTKARSDDAPRRPSSATHATTEPSTAKSPATVWQALKALSCAYNREDLERLLKDEEGKVLGETRLIHFIDTGGQAIYHDVHPVLITSPSVYLVVFSLKDFFEKSNQDKLKYFRSELIQRPLRSIYTFGTKKTHEKDHLELQPQAPKIFIVGTHLDQVLPREIREDFLSKLHEMISTEIGNKPYRQFVQYDTHGRAFWAVDNTQAGKEQDTEVKQYISTLRTMVQDKSMEMSVKVPLPWMLLKMVMDGKGDRYCKYSELLQEACDRGYVREDSPNEDLDTMLRLFHILGLLYHKVPTGYEKEDSLVFLDPDCLYSATSYFLMAAKEEIEGSHGGTGENDPQVQPAKEEMYRGDLAKAETRQPKPDPERIIQRHRVIRRMQDNVKSIRHDMKAVLKKVKDFMTKLDHDPTEVELRDLHAQLEHISREYMSAPKKTEDASSLRDKQQMFLGRLVHSLASAVASVLPEPGKKGDIRHIKKEIEKAKKNIQARCKSRSIDSNDMDQFLSILSDLRIIAKLNDSDVHVVPAALPELTQSLEVAGSADPILVTVVSQAIMQVCYLPSGLFCCLISELVTLFGWTVIPRGRTHVVFEPKELTGRVHMTEHESYIEINMESDVTLQELSETCQIVRERIHERIVDVFNKLCSGSTAGTKIEESVVWGFHCQAHPSSETHIAAFQADDVECCAQCLIESSCVQEVEPEQLAWFSSDLD